MKYQRQQLPGEYGGYGAGMKMDTSIKDIMLGFLAEVVRRGHETAMFASGIERSDYFPEDKNVDFILNIVNFILIMLKWNPFHVKHNFF